MTEMTRIEKLRSSIYSERIIADIEYFSNVLKIIVDEDGCMVSECKLRHGHRLLAHKGDRFLKRKVF